jgi:Mycothiol maleylpyruvate isomerase N-terminal domain
METVESILIVDLFEPMLNRLLELLKQLSEEKWRLATPCEGWSVKDAALHLPGDEIDQLSRGRDKDTSSISL